MVGGDAFKKAAARRLMKMQQKIFWSLGQCVDASGGRSCAVTAWRHSSESLQHRRAGRRAAGVTAEPEMMRHDARAHC
jgi:hypothetical protein